MTERVLNAIEILILAAILLGVLVLQLFFGEDPCPLCYLQRLFMFGIAVGLCLNLKCGVSKRHYGLALISAILGASISLRQMALHVCPDFSKFGEPFWGISLYTWAFFIFCASLAVNALMMIIFKKEGAKPLTWFDHTVIALIFIAAAINVVISFIRCGFLVCEDLGFIVPGAF